MVEHSTGVASTVYCIFFEHLHNNKIYNYYIII